MREDGDPLDTFQVTNNKSDGSYDYLRAVRGYIHMYAAARGTMYSNCSKKKKKEKKKSEKGWNFSWLRPQLRVKKVRQTG
jgi:hypothetical protein